MRSPNRQSSAFTIVELLIVIVVIAILAAVSIVAYSGMQQRARDSQRESDMAQIKKDLLLYQADNGGVPATPTFGGTGSGGWNYSSLPSWLSFLPNRPIDPINNPPTLYPQNDGSTYWYYCYPAGQGMLPATPNVVMGYRSEVSGGAVSKTFSVERCL